MEAARLEHGLAPPGADGARHDGHRSDKVPGAPLEVLRSDVLQRLPARQPVDAVANLGVAGDRAHPGVRKWASQPRHRLGGEDRVAVERDDHLAARLFHAEIERRGLAAIRLGEDAHARVFGELLAEHFQGPVLRAIVDADHLQDGRLLRQQ